MPAVSDAATLAKPAIAAVEALVSHPNVNASYNEDSNEITYHGSVNLGIAVDTEAGLLSPVIHNAQDLDIPGLAKAIIDNWETYRTKFVKVMPVEYRRALREMEEQRLGMVAAE